MPALSRHQRAATTKSRVIDAAIEAFGMEGFDRTSTRELVDRAGTNLVSIHYHFGSKEALYKAAAEQIGARIGERSQAVLERAERLLDTARTPRRQLIACVCDVFDDFAGMALE